MMLCSNVGVAMCRGCNKSLGAFVLSRIECVSMKFQLILVIFFTSCRIAVALMVRGPRIRSSLTTRTLQICWNLSGRRASGTGLSSIRIPQESS